MRNILTVLFFSLLFAIPASSQIHSIGHRSITFNDASRNGGYGSGGGTGRQIQTEIYYPSSAASDGDSTAIAAGQYPILIFGHGFVMTWSSYDNLWKDLVPQGYIMCFPRTEGGASPSHTDFGKDLALIQSKMQALNTNSASPFYNMILNKTAIMGHSMGGGSSFLACAGNAAPTTMVTFAAANTNPSSIVAAISVSIPTLLIAGQNDCVAPPAAHQDSMYLKCAAACKVEVTIKGAAHCEFADNSTTCSFGESTCSPKPTISATLQQSIASTYYSSWLKYWLKGDCSAWNVFKDSLNTAVDIVKQISCPVNCTVTGIIVNTENHLSLSPNPSSDWLMLKQDKAETWTVEVYDVRGRRVLSFLNPGELSYGLDLRGAEKGLYFMLLRNAKGESKSLKFIRN